MKCSYGDPFCNCDFSYIGQIAEAYKNPSFDPLDWSPYPESGLGYNLNPDSLNKAITLFPPGYGSCLHCPRPPQHNHTLCKDCEEAINNKLNDVIPKPSPWAVCECGAEKANEGRATIGHSSWCPKFSA